MADDMIRRLARELRRREDASSEDVLRDLVRLSSTPASSSNPKLPPEDIIILLNKRHLVFQKEYAFVPGQIVRWKSGLKNKIRPRENEPAIVLEVLETPLYNEREGPGTPYYREPLDIILGVIDDDGDFLTFYYDKRRFEPHDRDQEHE